jgi:hypothetical protein
VVEIRRGGAVADEELRRALENRAESAEIRGVLELLGRLEDRLLLDALGSENTQEMVELLGAIEGVREAARQVVDWTRSRQ